MKRSLRPYLTKSAFIFYMKLRNKGKSVFVIYLRNCIFHNRSYHIT